MGSRLSGLRVLSIIFLLSFFSSHVCFGVQASSRAIDVDTLLDHYGLEQCEGNRTIFEIVIADVLQKNPTNNLEKLTDEIDLSLEKLLNSADAQLLQKKRKKRWFKKRYLLWLFLGLGVGVTVYFTYRFYKQRCEALARVHLSEVELAQANVAAQLEMDNLQAGLQESLRAKNGEVMQLCRELELVTRKEQKTNRAITVLRSLVKQKARKVKEKSDLIEELKKEVRLCHEKAEERGLVLLQRSKKLLQEMDLVEKLKLQLKQFNQTEKLYFECFQTLTSLYGSPPRSQMPWPSEVFIIDDEIKEPKLKKFDNKTFINKCNKQSSAYNLQKKKLQKKKLQKKKLQKKKQKKFTIFSSRAGDKSSCKPISMPPSLLNKKSCDDEKPLSPSESTRPKKSRKKYISKRSSESKPSCTPPKENKKHKKNKKSNPVVSPMLLGGGFNNRLR